MLPVEDNDVPFRAEQLPALYAARILCPACDRAMTFQNQGFQCIALGCGKGFLRAEKGVKVRRDGNVTIFETDSVE